MTGAAEKVDRPEVLVIRGRTGVENVLDKLPPHREKIELKKKVLEQGNSHQVGSFALKRREVGKGAPKWFLELII